MPEKLTAVDGPSRKGHKRLAGGALSSTPSEIGPSEDSPDERALKRAQRYHASFPEVSVETIAGHLGIIGAGNAMSQAVARYLDAYGINRPRYSLLRALYFSPEGMLSQSELAKEVGSSQPNVTQLLHSLESDGFIERVIFPENRRVTFARLTSSGFEKCDELVPEMVRFMERSMSALSEDEKAQFIALLTRVRKTLESFFGDD